MQDYVFKPHKVVPYPVWQYTLNNQGSLSLKPYTMVSKWSQGISFVDSARAFIKDRLDRELIEPRLKLGFSVLSDGFLNVCIWGGEYPSILNQYLYEAKSSGENFNFSELDIRREGTFCSFELAIAGHEARAWNRFLSSTHAPWDEREYLKDRFKGIVK